MTYLLTRLLSPPHFEDEDSQRVANILTKLLVACWLISLIFTTLLLTGRITSPHPIPPASTPLIFVPLLYILLKRYRRVEWVANFFVLSFWVIASSTVLTGGGVNVIILGSYQLLTLFSTFILRSRIRVYFNLLCMVSLFVFYFAHARELIPHDNYDLSTTFAAQVLFLILLILFGEWIERSLSQNLKRAVQSEQNSRASEERLRVAISGLPVVVFNHDLELRYTWIYNDKNIDRVPGIIGKTDADILDPISAETLMSVKRRAISTGQQVREEVTFKINGQQYWFDLTVNPLCDSKGNITGITCASYNLHERKQVEATLAQSEARYRQMFEANPQPMWVYDLKTLKFLTVNDAAIAHYGYSRDEFLRMTIKDIRPPEDLPRLLEHVSQSTDQFGKSGIWRHLTKDGREILVEVASHAMSFAGHPTRLVLVTDVTERLHAEELLRKSEALFHTIFQSVPVAITISSLDQKTLFNVNDYFVDLVGYDREELLTTEMAKLPIWVSGTYKQDFRHQMNENGRITPYEVQWRARDGRVMDMLVSAQQIELGRVRSILGIGIDITERKRISEQQIESERMRLQVEQEREVVALKEQFISRMSHEFRTPLAIILSSKESLVHYYSRLSSERRQEHFEEIEKQTRYILELLDAVLTIGKVRAGKMPFQPAPIDLVTFSQKLMDQIRLTDKGEHEFIFNAQGDLSTAVMDERLLQHMIVNLISNALKYSPPNTTIRFDLTREDDTVCIRVADQGIGMSPEDVARLGEAFFRASNARRHQGTGLGLSIVKESVAAHRGTFSCDSRLNEGTTFTIRLPLRSSAVEQASQAETPSLFNKD